MKGYENDVMCIGPTAMDLVVALDSFPHPDQISLAAWSREFCGGSSANVAVGLARLGVYSGLLSKVGRDREGVMLLNRLILEGVDIRFVEIGSKTSRAIVLLTKSGEKTIIADTQGILTSQTHLPLDALEQVRALYVGECYFSVAEEALRQASARGIMSILRLKNVHFAPGFDVTRIISGADYVLMNEKTFDSFPYKMDDLPGNIIITRGEGGCAFPARDIMIEGARVTPVDTTGAGDAFCAGFISSLLSGTSLVKALHFANIAAALSTTTYGAMDSMPTRREVESAL